MILSTNKNYNKVKIAIETYGHKDILIEETRNKHRMNKNKHETNNKYICSICLSHKNLLDNNIESKRQTLSCSVCRNTDVKDIYPKHAAPDKLKKTKEICPKLKRTERLTNDTLEEPNFKLVQTEEGDFAQGMTLLNEVLTVFQSKKNDNRAPDTRTRTVILKDESVSTEDLGSQAILVKNEKKPNLTKSKMFLYSIEAEERSRDNNKFIVVNSCQPELARSHHSIILKHKSSSVPQMKMEELKHSLKEKVKSKGTIEEVNRMFATVRKSEAKDFDSNRPAIRSGPRVLPVVKTHQHHHSRDNTNTNDKMTSVEKEHKVSSSNCKNCQTHNLWMSGGDSVECCHVKTNEHVERCDKCVYVLCCQYRRQICEVCGKNNTNACTNGCALHNNDSESVTGF